MTGTLAVAGCPSGVRVVIIPVFYSSIDPDLGPTGRNDMRFLTFYAGVRLPEGFHRIAATGLHLLRKSGEALRILAPSFATTNVVRFAVARGCAPETDEEVERVMAAVSAD